MPRGPEKGGGMEKPKRARKRKRETSQGGPEATARSDSGGQGVHREVESEGHAEKYRAVIDGGPPEDEPVGQRWGKVEPALWRRRRTHSPTAPRCLRMERNFRPGHGERFVTQISDNNRHRGQASGVTQGLGLDNRPSFCTLMSICERRKYSCRNCRHRAQ